MNILLIRLRLIGDVVFTTPAIRALRKRFPRAQLTYVVEDAAAPVVRGNPHLNDVIVVPHHRGLGRVWDDVRLARTVRAAGYDVVIDFHGGPRSALLTWATGAAIRIGYTVPGRGWVYTRVVERPRELRARHSVENQFDLLAPLGINLSDASSEPAEMPADRATDALVENKLRQAGFAAHHSLILVHVSAGNPFRQWPVASFAETIVRLARQDGERRFVVTAGPSDRTAAERVKAEVRRRVAWNPVLDCEELSLAELHAASRRAMLFIGGDSGPMHIAGTTRVPIVALYGPTLPVRSAPWRDPKLIHAAVEIEGLPCRPCDQRRCIPGDYRCLTRVTPEMVVAASERALAGAGPHRISRAPRSTEIVVAGGGGGAPPDASESR